jgi:hypothetical protein
VVFRFNAGHGPNKRAVRTGAPLTK